MAGTLEDEFGIDGANEMYERQACEDFALQLECHTGPRKARHPDDPHPMNKDVKCPACKYFVWAGAITPEGICSACTSDMECQYCGEIVRSADIKPEGTCIACDGRNSIDAAEYRLAG